MWRCYCTTSTAYTSLFNVHFIFTSSNNSVSPDDNEGGEPTSCLLKTPPLSPTKLLTSSGIKKRNRTTSSSTSPSQGSVVRSGTKIIYTAGRPPWYDSHGQLKDAFVIGKQSLSWQWHCPFTGDNHYILPGWLHRACRSGIYLSDNVTGICGGSASGKTTVAKRIIEDLDVQWVSLLSMDSFYKVWNVLIINMRTNFICKIL